MYLSPKGSRNSRRDLNRKINDVLLAQEAQKRQVTTRALLDTEVNSKVPVFTEAEAQKFYDTNKDKVKGAFTDLKPQILRYLQDAEKKQTPVGVRRDPA